MNIESATTTNAPIHESYVESRGLEPYNWASFLAAPYHDPLVWKEAENNANNWCTCAVAEQPASILRRSDGMPWNSEIRGFGQKFYKAIEAHDLELARQYHAAIGELGPRLAAANR